jgi:hypothetical protein
LPNLIMSHLSIKKCVDVSCTGSNEMDATCRSHWMQKHKFGVMCHGALSVESVPVHASMKK